MKFKLFIILTMAVILCIIAFNFFNLRLNTTSSLPYGLYQLQKTDTQIKKGDIVLFCLKGDYSSIAAKRHYLSFGECENSLSPIGKTVAAIENDYVKISKTGIMINQNALLHTAPVPYDNNNNPLPYTVMDRELAKGELIVVSQKQNSFDSRYFGVINEKDIKGKLRPLLTF